MYTALANPPVRATTSITLAAHMLNIPLSLYTGTEDTKVARKEFFQGDANIPIGRAVVRKDTGEVVEATDVVRMAEATNGTWVEWTDDEAAACTSPRGVAEVIAFVPIKDFGQYLPEKLYQARPKTEKGKVNVAAEKAYGLLLAGMRARKVGALVKVAMRGPARFAILTTEGDLILVQPADAVRQQQTLNAPSLTKAEVAMAAAFIDAIGIDTPTITDDTAPVVQAAVDAKAGGAPKRATPVAPNPSDNLMAALQASIDAAKAGKGKVA
jgi:non-homologous end joining protein Ku